MVSYEAKAFGVKTGTLVRDARVMCPGIAIVQARPTSCWHNRSSGITKAAMQQLVSANTGATPTGRPRSWGSRCCSTDAK